MDNCVFCQIVAKKIPANVVYEDQDFLAFLDIRPLTRGNTLVIPKKHYRWVIDVDSFGDYWQAAKKVARGIEAAFSPEWTCFLTLGLEVDHAHIRVIPRYKNDLHGVVVDIDKFENYDQETMDQISETIKSKIGGV